jgi:hypothetical protein
MSEAGVRGGEAEECAKRVGRNKSNYGGGGEG